MTLPMKQSLIFFITFLVSSLSLASTPKLPTADRYKGGRFLCTGEYAPLIKHENGVFVSVPIDYSNPQSEKTDVYAFVAGGKLDPSLPTILYFTGGPGQASHWGLTITNATFNVILMDQRGIGCSRPATFATYMNPKFYSSENIARDADQIRKYFGLSQVTAYGVSYGTMPATIYGSLFPEVTRSVILEGTVYSQDRDLWESPLRRTLFQNIIDSLPQDIRATLDSVSTVYGVPNTWLYILMRDGLLHNNGAATLRANLMNIQDPQILKRLVETARGYFAEIDYEPHPLFTINDIPYYMIACQEMGLALKGISSQDAFVNGRFSPVPDLEAPAVCEKIRARSKRLYSAIRYPLSVPTYYFQGKEDSATLYTQAISHFQNVPRGKKTLLLMEKGGHAPSMSYLKMDNVYQLGIFTHAIMGEEIPLSLIDLFNDENSQNRWSKQ